MSLKQDLAAAKQQLAALEIEHKQALEEIHQANQRADAIRENARLAYLRVEDLEKQARHAKPLSKPQQAVVDLVKSGANIHYSRDYMGHYHCDNVIPDPAGRQFCEKYERISVNTVDSLIDAGHLRREARIGSDGKAIRYSWLIKLVE